MADYDSVSDPEALIQCPYDKFHMIRAKRLPYHLIKCKKNYAGNEFSVCPFNARHEMRKAELRYHMANCPDRARLETDFAYETGLISDYGTLFKGCTDVPAYHTNIQMKENWDQELSVTTRIGVHPDFFDNHQFKNLTGFTPEQKRQFYKNLKEGKNEFTDTSSHVEDEVRKLRVPHESSLAFKLMSVIPTDKPKPPDNVFLYSLTLAGIGRGKKLKQEE